MLRVGLTGGIASGKTTVSHMFADLGVPIIDADLITHQLMAPDTEITKQIIAHFGNSVVRNNQLDRKKIADIVFGDNKQLKWLEQLIHPAVRDEMQQQLKNIDSAYCILAIPLLVETLPNKLIDRILVVDCEPEVQLHRLEQRDNLSVPQAQKILAAQMSREQRLQHADDVITNNDDLAQLKQQVLALHQHYSTLG